MDTLFLLLGLGLSLVAGCGDDAAEGTDRDGHEGPDGGAGDGDGDGGGNGDAAVRTYARIVLASYEDTLSAAQALDGAIDAFLDDPDADGWADARQAWLDAREPYLQTEAFRFYDGPIDDPEDGPEGLINAWPLDEAFIDYVEGDPDAGIINDPDRTIDRDALIGLNEQGGEKNIATGFHAIEFLLWGQDMRDDGPGDRPHTDYVDGGSAAYPERRRLYLATVSDLLVSHLQQLVDAWDADGNNYREDFEALDADTALERILTGLIVLSGFETGGERLQTALDTAEQEDEHSCFSDNTHRDMVQDVRGMQNVWLGRYARTGGETVEGVGVREVVAARDADLADRVSDRIAESLMLAEDLQPPFDREIALDNGAGRARVTALVDSLQTQEEDLFDVFELLGLSVEIPE